MSDVSAALNIPAPSRSWKALVKMFIDDGQTSSFREKSIVREIRRIFRESFNI